MISIEVLQHYQTISIIGMEKNVGKTTTLNKIIKQVWGKFIIGLTSIGRDGESIDEAYNTPKPRIYVRAGTIIATARNCLSNCDITKEIMYNTEISTPMGDVIIIRALSDGYVELAGPSQTKTLVKTCKKFRSLGSTVVFVDGAISRKSFASPSITDATIIATGASVSENIHKVVDLTAHTVRLLSWEAEDDLKIISLSKIINKIGLITKDLIVENLNLLTAMDSSQEIIEKLDKNIKYLVIKGVLSDKILEDIMKGTDLYKEITILVEDGTKLFLSHQTLYKFQKAGGILKVINPINIIFMTANPVSPFGYSFENEEFLKLLRKKIDIPIENIINID